MVGNTHSLVWKARIGIAPLYVDYACTLFAIGMMAVFSNSTSQCNGYGHGVWDTARVN